MRGNSHVRFLEGKAPVMGLTYSTVQVIPTLRKRRLRGLEPAFFSLSQEPSCALFSSKTMAAYNINKGIGREVEFHGLKAQYLFYFAGGLLGDFLLVIVLYMMNAGQLFCILLGIVLGVMLVALTFRLNARYGTFGLLKEVARRRRPRRIIHRRDVRRLLIHSSIPFHF